MLHWLAILAVIAALTGSQLVTSQAPLRVARWMAGSLLLTALIAAPIDAVLPVQSAALYRPLLAGLVGGVVTWILGAALHRDGSADTLLPLAPYINLIAAGWSWLLLAQVIGIGERIGLSLLAAASCSGFLVAGAAFASANDRLPRLLLGLGVVLLALSALATIG